MRYVMIIEPGARNYSAYLPDLPGCVATGQTIAVDGGATAGYY
jgi:predicted RNase H-like HicB family nuclease